MFIHIKQQVESQYNLIVTLLQAQSVYKDTNDDNPYSYIVNKQLEEQKDLYKQIVNIKSEMTKDEMLKIISDMRSDSLNNIEQLKQNLTTLQPEKNEILDNWVFWKEYHPIYHMRNENLLLEKLKIHENIINLLF